MESSYVTEQGFKHGYLLFVAVQLDSICESATRVLNQRKVDIINL